MRTPEQYVSDFSERRRVDESRPIPQPREMPPVEVWCHRCIEPATVAFRLTLGEVRSYCDVHAWALRAPRGGAS